MENNIMNIEMNKPNKPHCPVIDVNGLISDGKQFDLDITLPEDNRDVIYGKIKNMFKEPIKNAVVKLIEIDFGKDGRKKRIPVSHTFTDKYGEFVFGPLCPDKKYGVQIWANKVKHYKLCADCRHEGKCLKGVDLDKCDFKNDDKDEYRSFPSYSEAPELAEEECKPEE